ncbi:MAG: yhjA [Labilithrix sp.]|nr:yhjA [Labilithrix sp.]
MVAAIASRRRYHAALALGIVVTLGAGALAVERQHVHAARAATPAPPPAPVVKRQPIQPVPRPAPEDPRRVGLGAMLFADARLSADGSVACATCHDLGRGGADGRVRSTGAGGAQPFLNTPTIFNVALNPRQHWDGRADQLEAQIDEPITSPRIMNMTWDALVTRLSADPVYGRAFERAYGGPPTAHRIRNALATYERTLVLQDSPFDRYLGGDAAALTREQLEGFALFKSYGCASCHQGRNVGGNVFEVLGIVGDYFAVRGTPILPSDLGRFNVTKRPEDRFRFRVPSLRAAALTPPYLHDGTAATLADAVRAMGRFQLGATIPAGDVDLLVAFLGSLVGTYVPAPAEGP